MEEKGRITQINIEDWPFAILIISEDDPHTILHAVLYQTSPDDYNLASLKDEFIKEFEYEGDADKLKYVEVPSEEFMELIGAEEIEYDD